MTINWEKVSQFTMPEDSAGYLLWQVVHLWQRQVEIERLDAEFFGRCSQSILLVELKKLHH